MEIMADIVTVTGTNIQASCGHWEGKTTHIVRLGKQGTPGALNTDSGQRPARIQSRSKVDISAIAMTPSSSGVFEMLNVEEVGGVGLGFVKRILREKAPGHKKFHEKILVSLPARIVSDVRLRVHSWGA